MHNMSEQFYKYISQVIINYLEDRSLEGGERFNLYIEQPEVVNQLYSSIEKEFQDKISTFHFKHDRNNLI